MMIIQDLRCLCRIIPTRQKAAHKTQLLENLKPYLYPLFPYFLNIYFFCFMKCSQAHVFIVLLC